MNRLVIVLMIASIVGGAGWFKSCTNARQARLEAEELAEFTSRQLSNKQKQIEKYKAKNGQLVTTNTQLQLDKHNLKKVVQEQADLLDLKSKRITSLTSINARLRIENIQLKTQERDTIYINQDTGDTTYITTTDFSYSDQWVTLNGTVNRISGRLDSLMINAPLDITVAWQRKKLKLFGKRRKWTPRWGAKENKVFVTSPNPYYEPTDIKSFTIRKK